MKQNAACACAAFCCPLDGHGVASSCSCTGLPCGDVLSHGFDFDGEVCVGGGVEVSDGDHADELFVGCFYDWDVTDFAIGHEVSCFGECGFWGAVDDFLGHRFGDWCGRGIELLGHDACEDVAFGDDAGDVVECV